MKSTSRSVGGFKFVLAEHTPTIPARARGRSDNPGGWGMWGPSSNVVGIISGWDKVNWSVRIWEGMAPRPQVRRPCQQQPGRSGMFWYWRCPKQRIYFLLVFCIRMKSPFYLMVCKELSKNLLILCTMRHNGHFLCGKSYLWSLGLYAMPQRPSFSFV